MKGVLCGLLLMACSAGVAVVMVLLWIMDYVQVCEPNSWIRGTELAVSVGMCLYGLWYFIHELKEHF